VPPCWLLVINAFWTKQLVFILVILCLWTLGLKIITLSTFCVHLTCNHWWFSLWIDIILKVLLLNIITLGHTMFTLKCNYTCRYKCLALTWEFFVPIKISTGPRHICSWWQRFKFDTLLKPLWPSLFKSLFLKFVLYINKKGLAK